MRYDQTNPRLTLERWSWILLLTVSCRPGTVGPELPAPDPCRVLSGSSSRPGPVTVAFSEGENRGGRLLLRLTGESLLQVDCAGRIHPGLARRWYRDASGSVWTFDLGEALPAQALVERWNLRRNGGIWPWARILEARATQPYQLEVRLDSSYSEIPLAFAHPDLAVAPGLSPDSGPGLSIRVLQEGVDQRDLLDSPGSAVDVLITRDPAVISYAAGRADFADVPLPWDRTYVLLTPVTRPDLGSGEASLPASLARDVVRAPSRAAEGPFWWEATPCPGTMPLLPMGGRFQIVYPQGDQTARELAERLVALARSPLRAAGLSPGAFHASLAGGEAVAYVLPLPRVGPGVCSALPQWPAASSVLSLVDTRAHALVRDGVPSFMVLADGTIRFDRPLPVVPAPAP